MTNVLRIGNAGGYWGDDLAVLRRQVEGGPIDVVTADFLAEITMSILQKQFQRDPQMGYARDFVTQMKEVMPIAMKRGVTIITNAGGVRPDNCVRALQALADEMKLTPRLGLVGGDGLLSDLDQWHRDGVDMSNMDDGRGFAEVVSRVTSANAYFGASPVVRALEMNAQFIVTGRVTDTGITLAPMMHHFGWSPTDYDLLAAGIVAGHILECGAQSTGGNFTDWRTVPTFDNIGYPIVEMNADGSFVITKHEGTGGMVTVSTVKEQLVYEMGDPLSYITPDVVVDFSSIRVEADGPDRVRVWGVRGAQPTPYIKVSMSYQEGYKASGAVVVSGPDARAKCEAFGDILWGRLPKFDETLTEYVGADSTWGPLSPTRESSEVLLRFGVRDADRDKVAAFSKMLPALILSGPPGVAVTGGRPPVQDVVAYWPCLVPRELCKAHVEVHEGDKVETDDLTFSTGKGTGSLEELAPTEIAAGPKLIGRTRKVRLSDLAHGRSGDKGDTCNIGVVARHASLYPWLRDNVTAAMVKKRFEGIAHGKVERFEVPNIDALNFLLHESLGGGGTLSLHIDAQGKTLSHALLAAEFEVDEAWLQIAGL